MPTTTDIPATESVPSLGSETFPALGLSQGSAVPVFRRKGAYSMDCYSRSMKTLMLFYPFIPRRNTKASEYMSFKKSGSGIIRHFRFLRVSETDPTNLIYRQVRRVPNNESR